MVCRASSMSHQQSEQIVYILWLDESQQTHTTQTSRLGMRARRRRRHRARMQCVKLK